MPYINQTVNIGYYYQKDFLWFNNTTPQLVSLTVNKKIIRSYEDTLYEIKDNQRSFWYFHGIFGIFFVALFLFSDYYIKQP